MTSFDTKSDKIFDYNTLYKNWR